MPDHPEQNPPAPIPPDVIAKAVIRLTHAVEQTTELLVAVTDLHRKVAELHGALTEPLVELERVLGERARLPDEE
jgi:hypothetical protein